MVSRKHYDSINHGLRAQAGQGVLEFLFAFLILLGILFLYIQLGLGTVASSFAEYASFMASRALLTSGEAGAKVTLEQLLGTPETSRLGFALALQKAPSESNSYVVRDKRKSGVAIPYKIPFVLPFIDHNAAGEKPFILTSEAFHGEEVSANACRQDLTQIVGQLNDEGDFNECRF